MGLVFWTLTAVFRTSFHGLGPGIVQTHCLKPHFLGLSPHVCVAPVHVNELTVLLAGLLVHDLTVLFIEGSIYHIYFIMFQETLRADGLCSIWKFSLRM